MQFSFNFYKKIKLDGFASGIKVQASRAVSSLLLAMIAAIGTQFIVSAAPTVLATMTAAFVGVHDGDGKADPGETIEYTAVIQNSGADPATGVTFNDIIDLNTTLVDGSLNVSPLAADDSYATIGNTLLEVGVTASGDPAVRVTSAAIDSLFDNDTEFLGDSFTLLSVEADSTAPFTTATEQGGSVTVEADGNFSYTPPVDFTGTDNFDYVISDDGAVGSSALTGVGRVTINVTQMVWYVKNDAPAGGLGRSTDPFDTLAEAQTASAANETIYVFQGNGTTTGQNAGITLQSGQRLIGEGVALTVPVSVNGGANPTTLRTAGAQPQIDNTGGFGVSVLDISNVQIFGLNIAGNTNAVNVTTTAANSGSFELANNTIRSAGANGVDVNGGGTGTLTVNLHDNLITSTGNGIDIQRTAGSIAIAAFDDNVVSGSTGGAGINIVGPSVTFDTTPGGTFQAVSGGTTIIGISGDGVGASGIVLTNVSGDLSFTDLDIFASTGNGLSASGTTAYTGSAGFQIAVTPAFPDNFGTSTINVTSGPALSISQATVDLRLSNLTSTTTTSGLSLTTVAGQVRAPSGSSITKSSGAGTAFTIASSSVTLNYAGTLNVTSGGGVSLTSNTGATITFSGGLTLSTGSNAAFTATGGGTVNVCDENPCNPAATGSAVNTLISTTGTALNIADTTIGANNLEFRSISSNGAVNGIVLNNTGSGGLTVTGNSSGLCGGSVSAGPPAAAATVTAPVTADCTGGTIQNSTGSGIVLTNANSVNLKRLWLRTSGDDGIKATNVTGFTMTSSFVDGNGNALNESSLDFGGAGVVGPDGLHGTGSITNSTIQNGYYDNITLRNSGGVALTAFTVTGSQFRFNPANGDASDNILFEAGGTANMAISVSGSFFASTEGDHFQAAALNSGTLNVNFTNNTLTGGHSTPLGQGITINAATGVPGWSGRVDYDINGNNITGAVSNGVSVVLGTSSAAAVFDGFVRNNVIGVSGSSLSCSTQANGVYIDSRGNGTHNSAVTGNTIRQCFDRGILTEAGDGDSVLNLTVTGNTIDQQVDAMAREAIQTNFGITSTNVFGNVDTNNVCLQLGGAGALANTFSHGGGAPDDFRLRKRQEATVRLPGYGGGTDQTAGSLAQVVAFIQGQNTGSAGEPGSATASGAGGGYTGGAPCTQPIAMVPSNHTLASALPSDNNSGPQAAPVLTSLNDTTTVSTNLNSANNTVVNASTTIGGGKPLFHGVRPAPALSGETVTVPAFTLPAGKSVTIKFQVTVNGPSLPLGTTQISNQATLSGSNFSNVLTDDPSPGGGSDPTITLVDRPDTTVTSINRTASSPTNSASVSWIVTFADAASGLTSSNFALVNGGLGGTPAITAVTPVGGAPATQWTVTASTGTGEGTLGLNLTNDTGLSHDMTNLIFTGQAYSIDRTPPTVTMSSAAANPTNISPIPVTVQFSEAVGNFTAADIVAGNATVGNFNAVDGDTYTFDLTPGGQGLVTADIGASAATDTAGNGNTAATQFSRTFDSVPPSVTMSSSTSNPTNANPIPVTAQFSEAVGNFTAADILAGNATVGNFIAVDGDTYTFELTPSASGIVTADIPAGVAQDSIGNSNTAATQFSRSFDSDGPTATISSVAPDPINTSPIRATAQFSEAVTGFTAADILAGNATVGNFIAVDGDTYTFDLTPSAQGLVTADIAAGVAQDNSGNLNSSASQFSRTFDSSMPTVTMSSLAPDPTNTSPIPVTVQFSENVTGFDVGDLTPGNATVGNFLAVDGDTYTFDLTPSTPGLVTADIADGVATDSAGNGNTVAAQFSLTFDSDSPTVAMSSTAANPTNTSPIPVTVQFSEDVTGFDASDVTPGNATVGSFIAVDGDTYTFDLTPLADGLITADIAADVAQDASSNGNSPASQFSRTFDTLAPTVTLNQAAGQADPTSTSISFTVTFDEPVNGFGDSAADVNLSGTAGVATAVVTEIAPNDGTTYNVGASGMTVSGTVIASIPAGAALDEAGNDNSASTSTDNTVTFIADAVSPQVSSVDRADSNPTSAASVDFTVTFSEDVTGVDLPDFTLTTTGVSGANVDSVSGSGAVYTVTVNTGTDSGTIRLDVIDNGTILDGASNPLAGGFTGGQVYTVDKIPNVGVTIAGTHQGQFVLPTQGSTLASFAGVNTGAVKLESTNALPFLAAEQVIYRINGTNISFSEMMGLPDSLLDTTYWLPWYNNVDLDTQLRIGNASNSSAAVHVYLGGVEMTGSPFTLAPGASTRLGFPGVNNGPVKIESDHGVPIVAAQRLIYTVNGLPVSFSEAMAIPNSQLSTTYWLPWYNNVDLNTQLRIANVSGSPAAVTVTIGGQQMPGSPFNLAAGASIRLSFAGINNGPVKIESTQNIVAAERVIYKVNGTNTSFSEMMGVPDGQLDTTYWFPWYNNVDLDTLLRLANVSSSSATVHVYIGGVEMTGSPFTLAPGANMRLSFAGVNNGPVKIVSDQDILVGARVIYRVNGTNTSFSELMGLPDSQLNTTYWLPWYNNVDLNTQLRFDMP